MLHAHKLLDGLRWLAGENNGAPVRIMTPLGQDGGSDIVRLALPQADKYDFGVLHNSFSFDTAPARAVVADQVYDAGFAETALTPDEVGMWADGIVPLPHDMCWYEWSSATDRRRHMAMIVKLRGEEADGIVDHPSALDYSADSWVVYPVFGVDKDEYFFPSWAFRLLVHRDGTENGRIIVAMAPERGADAFIREARKGGTADEDVAYRALFQTINIAASIPYLTLMLNSTSTEMRREGPPERLNKKRTSSGRTPLFSHHVVDLVPSKYISYEGEGGTHASPRLHWRRSHVRHYSAPTPRAKQTPDGRWAIVIPRCLVGKRELGEVTKDYRVRIAADAARAR